MIINRRWEVSTGAIEERQTHGGLQTVLITEEGTVVRIAPWEARKLILEAQEVKAAAKPDPWVDTRIVSFDHTMNFGHGYDFDGWYDLREEIHTPHGSWAVWPHQVGGKMRWSLYGGSLGTLVMEQYSTKEEAKSEVEAILLSMSEYAEMERRALAALPNTIRQDQRIKDLT